MLKLGLFSYQQEGVDFMMATPKCLNLDDCGLGKTAQALAYIDALNKDALSKVVLVVKPENILQWESEIEKFTDLTYIRVDGSKKKRERQYSAFKDGNDPILLINYEKIIYDWSIIKTIITCADTAIFDEAFALKNPESLVHTRFEMLTESFSRVVMLTATPIGATLYDFYNIMRVMHITLPSDEDFISQYVEVEDTFVKMAYRKYAKHPVFKGSKNIDDFKETYSKYFIRRENKDQFDFALSIHKHSVAMSDAQRDCCYKLQQAFINQGPDDTPIPAVRVYSQFAQIAEAPFLINPEYTRESPKVNELIEILQSNDEQFVVYAKYVKFHDIIIEALEEAGISYQFISGRDKLKVKDEKKKAFEAGKVRVLLITDAGKVGLNLQVARNLVLMDVPATASDCFQFIGRVYRTGQKLDVNVYFLYVTNSLEEDQISNIIFCQRDIDKFFDQDKAEIFNGLPCFDKLTSFIKRKYR